MQPRIRWRSVLPFLLLIITAVLVYALASLNTIRQEEQARWEAHFLNLSQLMAVEAAERIGTPAEAASLNQIAERYADPLGVAILFLSPDGAVLGSSSPPIEDPPNPALVTQAQQAGRAARLDQGNLTIARMIMRGNEVVGMVYLQVPRAGFRADLSQLWGLGVVVVLAACLAGLVLSMILHDYALKPIERLTIAAQQMGNGTFHTLDFPETPQELSALNQSLQEMAQHLGDQIDALTSERAKLSAVLNQMTDGVLIVDLDGRVQLLNPAAERLFQIDAIDALGRSVVEVLRYHQLVELWRVAKEGQQQTTMIEIGPQHLFLQATGMPLKTSDKGSTLILFQDLTQLRRLETVRRDFISNVSHELRTPLASLKALGETLQESALDDPPAARRFIIRMETEIDNLTQLVNELLELSRIESGKVPLSFHRARPCDLLRPACERMELQVERAGLNLALDCQPDLPIVFADPNRITQVVINLIHNATKFTPPGGQITVSAYQDGEFIVFFVKDTGVGIPKEDLGRIFERFYKADRARSGGGTGLGLSIARHMVESHGGFIWAESEEEMGSTIYFSLPVA
jgi:two-component system phosphate regulon sensor histidine kinase PhoR